MTRSARRPLGAVIALACLTCAVPAASAPAGAPTTAPSVEELFTALCTRHDASYAACRDLLVERGRGALAFLKAKARDGRALEQLAAEDVILHVTQPQAVAKWRRGLTWGAQFNLRQDHTVLSVLKKGGAVIETAYDKTAVPFLVGELWIRSQSQHVTLGAIYRMLAHLGDERAVWALTAEGPPYDMRGAWVEAVVKFAKKATPALRKCLAEGMRSYQILPQCAADALGEIGDASAARELEQAVATGQATVALAAAKALCRMKHPGAARTIWPVLLELSSRSPNRRDVRDIRRNLRYAEMRDALGLLGPALAGLLKQKRAETKDDRIRVICDGLLARFGDPKAFAPLAEATRPQRRGWLSRGQPYPIPPDKMDQRAMAFLMEEAWIMHNSRAVATLGLTRDPRAFGAIAANVGGKGSRWRANSPVAIRALGDLGDARGIEVLLPLASDPRLMGGESPPARLAAWSIFRIGGPQAAKALRDAAAKNPALGTEAAAYADVLAGRGDQAVKLLASDDAALRAAAACALVSRGDLRALGAFLDHLAGIRGPQYLRLRPLLSALGKAGLDALRREADRGEWNRRLPAESALLEITRPQAVRKCRDLLTAAVARIAPMHVHTYGMVDGAAKGIAARVAAEDAPIFEEAMYFGTDEGRRLSCAVAAAVLGYLKQDRSLPALAASARMPAFRNRSPVFEALKRFGKKGEEVAAKLPDPDPQRARFPSRAGRAVRAADMLAGLDHEAGVRKLLGWYKAWRRTGPAQRRSMGLGQFLRAARKLSEKPDPRLLTVLLDLFGQSDRYTRVSAALALENYDDPRVVPLILSALGSGSNADLSRDVLTALTHRAGDETPKLLAKAFASSPPAQARPIAAAIAVLAKPDQRPGRGAGWYPGAYDTPAKLEAAAAMARKVALPVLYEALEKPDSERSCAAAHGLLIMGDAETHRRLAAWVAAGGNFQWHNAAIVVYLAEHRLKGAEPGILRAFRSRPGNITLVRLVGVYQIGEAIPALTKQLRTAPAQARQRYELGIAMRAAESLAAIGKAGRDVLVRLAAGEDGLATRVYAAGALGRVGDARALAPAVKLLGELERSGEALPGLPRLADDARAWVRRSWYGALFDALASVGGAEAGRVLRRLAALNADKFVRDAALRHLQALEAKRNRK